MALQAKHFPQNVDTNNTICQFLISMKNTSKAILQNKSSTRKTNRGANAFFCTLCTTAWQPITVKHEKTHKFLNGLSGLGLTKKHCPDCNAPVL